MGFFKSLRNSLRKDNVKSSVQLVNSSGNYFTAWDGRVFDNDIVRGAINARAKRISKVELKHCFKPPNGKLEKVNEDANYRFLLEEPNPYMTMPGLAASAASVIACAGYSEIAPTAMIMVHNVSSTARGDYHAMDKSSEILQEANKSIAAAYREKTGKSEAELLQLMDEETWLTAEKAVEYGLIDKISESAQGKMKLVASYSTKMLSREVIEKMQAQKAKERMQAQLDLLQII